MKQKVLMTATIAKHLQRFHLPLLEWFQNEGYETHVACEGDEELPFCDYQWRIPFVRSPYSMGNVVAYNKLKRLLREHQYVLIHCQTPIAGIITRLVALNTTTKQTKVVYTAHGFHFYNSAPWSNWMIYYPLELIASRWADAIITVNYEDYNRIEEKGNPQTHYYKISGCGVNVDRFYPVDTRSKIQLRKCKSFSEDDFLMIYAAEFIPRKNHKFIIDLGLELFRKLPKAKILFAGRGRLEGELKNKVQEKGLADKILFLGFREDINEIYQLSDIGVSASRQEGLPTNIMEEMMSGLPILASIERGHNELVQHEENGYLYKQEDSLAFIDYASKLYHNDNLRSEFSKASIRKSQKYALSNVVEQVTEIYQKYLPV